MSDQTKRYLDYESAKTLVKEIKDRDAATLQSANEYADSLATNYDAAGSSASALEAAKGYADTQVTALADGQVELNKEAIDILNGADTVDGSVAKSVKDAKDALQGNIDGVDAKADANAEAIAAINNAETGILKQAKDFAVAEDVKVQTAVDELSEKVGDLPEGTTAKTVVEYVNVKTAGIATDAALADLNNQVSGLQTAVQEIQTDYLKAADKTALQGLIDGEVERAEGIESGLRKDVDNIKKDYLKATDKTELTNAIDAAKKEAIATVLGEGVDEDFNTLKEVADWILSDTTGAAALQTDVAQLKIDVDAVKEDMIQAQKDIDNVELEVAGKVAQTDFDGAIELLGNADTSLGNRIKAIEDKFVEGEGSVSDMIADAVAEGVAEAAEDAKTKADKALEDAKKYANEEFTKDRLRLDALEEIDHNHTNKTELDLISFGDVAKWNAAAGKAHEHSNAEELDKIASGNVAKWNDAEQNAKEYASGLNTTMTTRVDGLEGRVTNVETKADSNETEITNIKTTHAEDKKNLQDAIDTNARAIGSFSPISPSDITALFNATN